MNSIKFPVVSLVLLFLSCSALAGEPVNLLTNGSFEFWSHVAAERLGDMLKNGPVFDDAKDPLVPTRWQWGMGQANKLTRSTDAHSGKYSLSIVSRKGGGGQVSMGRLEVVPGAKYSFGIWAKGSGDVTVEAIGEVPEGSLQVGVASGKAGKDWAKVGGELAVPGNVRLLWLRVNFGAPADLLFDDAYVAAPLDRPYAADDVLTKKYDSDADTLLMLDFDQKEPVLHLENKVKLTDANGGRFGRGLRLDGGHMRSSLATTPFPLSAMPKEGTVEFWICADEMPNIDPKTWEKPGVYLQIKGATTSLLRMGAFSDSSISCSWCADATTTPERTNGVPTDSGISACRMHKGEWHHFAVTWAPSAWRFYVDGMLSGMTTKPPLGWGGGPVSLGIGSEYDWGGWDGVIDEVRISKVQRYGVLVPAGATPNPLPVPQEPLVVKAAEPAKPKDYRPERAKLLGSIAPTQAGAFETTPNPDGQYVYEATSVKPLVDGIDLLDADKPGGLPGRAALAGPYADLRVKLQPDNPVKGLTTAMVNRPVLLGLPNLGGMYWRMRGIKAGPYWIGVVIRTGADGQGVEIPANNIGQLDVYLNGREVQCSTYSDPVQVAPGAWFAMVQAAEAAKLKEGDEISILPNGGGRLEVARLVLLPKEPVRGPHRTRMNPGPNTWNQDTALGITTESTFVADKGKPLYPAMFDSYFAAEQWMESADDFQTQSATDGSHGRAASAKGAPGIASKNRDKEGRAIAHCSLANPLPVPVEVEYTCVVTGFYREEAGRDTARLTLAPHAYITRDVAFKTTADNPAYSIHSTIKAVNPPALQGPVMDWPEFDALPFFPGLRHLMPWTNPYEYSDHRRLMFKQPVKETRSRMSLGGDWEFAFSRELEPPMPPPAGLKFEHWQVPPLWGNFPVDREPKAHALYLKRKLTLPYDPAGRTVRVVVDSVSSEGTIYVNGTKVGNVRGYNTPLIGDATAALHAGQNEIVLVIRDVSAIMDPQYLNKDNPVVSLLYMDAPGDCNAQFSIRGDVVLESSPAVEARDIKIETSVRNKKIDASMTVTNHSKGEVRLSVAPVVQDARQPALTFDKQEVTIGPGQSRDLKFSKDWANPRLWNWKEPNLYVLAVDVTDAANGKRLDLARERFGFRESWLQGDQIYFNGHPTKYNGVCNGPAFSNRCDSSMTRNTMSIDASDETGGPATIQVSGLTNTPSKHNVDRDQFWQATQADVESVVRRNWNHPSLVAWDLSNEWHHYAPYTGADMGLCSRRFKALSDAVRKLDPTRWTFCNGDDDIGGLLDNFSSHYLLDSGRPRIAGGFGFDGHSVYLPDGAFFRPLTRDFKPDEEVLIDAPQNHKFRLGSKVLMDSEDMWKVGDYLPPATAKYMDEDDVLSTANENLCPPMVWMWKSIIDGQREMGLAMHCFDDSLPGLITRGDGIQTFVMPDTVHHGFAGAKQTRSYTLINDEFHGVNFTFTWKFVGPDGKPVTDGKDSRDVGPGALLRGWLPLTLPEVTQRTKYTLQLRLSSDGQFVRGEDRDIEVWPNTPVAVGPTTRKIFLYDPKGATAEMLKSAGAAFESVSALSAPAGEASASVLVIGEGALDEKTAKQAAGLTKFVEDGGHVVVLAQTVAPEGLPIKAGLDPREWVSQPYVRLPIHPILQGITSWDLHFWSPARVSAKGAYYKPDSGPAIPLVDSGTQLGLEWVELMEMYRGKGAYLLCQLSLVGSAGDEPMAREMFARVLRYGAAAQAFRVPTGRFHLVAAKGSPLERTLQELNIAFVSSTPDAVLDLTDPTLLECGVIPTVGQQATWKAAMTKGATLVVTNVRPEDAPWLSSLSGQSVKITVPRYRMWEGRAYRATYDVLTAGLSHLDLFWKQYDWKNSSIESPAAVFEQLQDVSVEVAQGRELVFPGALVEVNVGSGRLILDQRRWMTSNDKLTRLAGRNVCSLALGLGVAISPIVPPREMSPDVAYRPIDLSPYANRAFADDVADDGKGGWTDQGPSADLHDFPTGNRDFRGVPFIIGSGAKAIVVLASDSKPGKDKMPWEVTIPVGQQVEGFCFLHSVAYTGERAGQYQVQYADGTTAEISLKINENIRDWTDRNTEEFPHEKGSKSYIAWTGTCKMFGQIGVYMMRWVNPRPEVSVVAVRFSNPGRDAVPVLLGLTAAVKKDAKAAEAALAKAQDLFKKARDAMDANKKDDAKTLLQQAIAAWPALTAAHQALADMAEQSGNENEVLEVYRRWTSSGARTPLPWNRLGAILEKRKDYKGALEAYNQSLKVEWNQPPTIDAKARLENMLREQK
jgi:hypothetical protein